MTESQFAAHLWLWEGRRSDTWTFVTLPPAACEVAEDVAATQGPRKGFGSVPVSVQVGTSQWRTSVFPDKARGAFVLPIKAAVRKANDLHVGDEIAVTIEFLAEPPP